MQQPIRIRALSTEVARRIREAMVDDFGNRLTITDSPEGGAPCRHCLRRSADGERLILFAYRPFEAAGPYAEVGPVFIHADECAPYADASAFPPAFSDRALTLRAYDDRRHIAAAEVAAPGAAVAAITRMLADERVRSVHVRNPAWGCFSFAVERAT
jgi:hypothetical protein